MINFRPHQIIRLCGPSDVFFEVTGNYLGGLGQQNLVGLMALNRSPGSARCFEVKEMLVPEELLRFALMGGAIVYEETTDGG